MNTFKISLFMLLSAIVILLGSCCATQEVTTTWGTQVIIPKCIQQIKYSGNGFKIGEVTIPIGQEKVNIKGVEWDTKKLQDAAAAIQAMEQTRLRLCEEKITDVQLLKYDDYLAKDKKSQETQDKLDQLAYLVTLNNPQAVEKWIDVYLTTVAKSTGTKSPLSLEEPSVIPRDVGVQNISIFLK